jgi:RNA polymerase sigma-70 factor (ECF subfamily)
MDAVTERGPATALLALYDVALPEVYGYLRHRCRDAALAEDLTAETFLAAARAINAGSAPAIGVGWLVAVARNKLVDHWRRREREERAMRLVAEPPAAGAVSDAEGRGLEVLRRLPADYRAALVLRHVDGLSVPDVAAALERSLHATEALLSRARRAFRRLYEEVET